MNAELLLAHFDRISDAPDAVPRLRRFVLDLAVRGKLVEQDPTDEQALALLKRIEVEKRRLTKVSGLKHPDLLPVNPNEVPFDLPSSWAWMRVGWGFQYDAGAKREPSALLPDRWLLELEDIEKDTSVVQSRLTVKDRDSRSTKSEFLAGDILYGKLRPYLNKVVVADEDGYSTTEIVAIRSFVPMSPSYCCLAFRRPDFVAYVSQVGRGTKMPRLRTEDALVALFPVPPLAEQYRIVAKVDELMALCDRLEVAQRERESRRDRLAASTHHHLNNGADAEFLRVHAQFFIGHLPRITAHPEQIKQLRQTILNLAVRGKLVSQHPSDKPIAELLREIRREQDRQAKQGIIPKRKPAKQDNAMNLCPEFPACWANVEFMSLCNIVTSGSRGWAEHYADKGPRFLRAQNIRFGQLRLDNPAYVNPPASSEGIRTRVSKGDLLIVITGAGVTNPALLEENLGEAYVSQHVALIKPTNTELSPWLLLYLMADHGGRSMLVERAYGSGKPGLNLDNIRSLPIPLPPLAEQHRIVAKVDELMALCDQLEARLTTAQTEASRLLESVLYNALQ